MSGFSTDWLALREPADRAARAPELVTRLATWLKTRPTATVLDLGCGTGATVRALVDRLPGSTRWHLVDHDPALLAEAERQLSGRGVEVHSADLAGDLSLIDAIMPDVITGSALIDLVSEAWLSALIARANTVNAAFYMALAYDGREAWTPAHPMDARIHAAFLRDQAQDKGFGPALGPKAAARLSQLLQDAGFQVSTAVSPWRLSAATHAPLIAALADGIAEAAARHLADQAAIEVWRAARRAAESVEIGHLDVLALPP